MSRKRSNTTVSLPTPAPENIATREYYRSSETNDAHDRDIDYPVSRRPSPEEQEDKNSEGVSSTDINDFVGVSKDRPYSPSPSDIVTDCDLEDTMAMANLDRVLREGGAERAKRKKELLWLQEKSRLERREAAEETAKARLAEIDREYDELQSKGRDEV